MTSGLTVYPDKPEPYLLELRHIVLQAVNRVIQILTLPNSDNKRMKFS